jgi:23S rRNA (cytidine1920-2'-O)/16S rRNA (cytidine1409-2'-O)-methyltransferase
MTVRLDSEVFQRNLTSSRNQARELIHNQQVLVNGIVAQKASQLVSSADRIEIVGEQYVSRAAYKLLGAVDEQLRQRISGANALDIGASTGGFTQVLLNLGAAAVTALDVGSNQLSPVLTGDDRVTNFEQTNIRNYQQLFSSAQFDIITCDVSFISLTFVIPAVQYLLSPNGVAILLIKPQFELGKNVVKKFKNGIITDSKLHQVATDQVVQCAVEHNLSVMALTPADLTGSSGNQEYVLVVGAQLRPVLN